MTQALTDLATRASRVYRNEGVRPLFEKAISFVGRNVIPIETRTTLYATAVAFTRHPGIGNPLRVYPVDPQEIDYVYTGDPLDFIAGGDWDENGKQHVDDWFRMRMFTKHFEEGVPWRDIEEFRELERTLREEGWVGTLDTPPEEHTPEALLAYHEFIDQLYEEIDTNGYKRQTELDRSADFAGRDRHPSLNEIQVRIGRDGTIMPDTGYNRFTIAKLLGLKSVPVRTSTRHVEWQRIRDEIRSADAYDELDREARRHVGHPELADIVPEHVRRGSPVAKPRR